MPLSASIPTRSLWAVADLKQLPRDGNHHEVLHGELVVAPMASMPPAVLVLEFQSPSTRTADRHRKRPSYLTRVFGQAALGADLKVLATEAGH